jgi:hypothetical protein
MLPDPPAKKITTARCAKNKACLTYLRRVAELAPGQQIVTFLSTGLLKELICDVDSACDETRSHAFTR